MNSYQPVDPDSEILVDGVPTKIRDLRSAGLRAMMGYGHFPQDISRREVHPGYPQQPGECTYADKGSGVWINDGRNLVCEACGLDLT